MLWYEDYIVAAGRAGVVWILIAFVTTFLITRGITRKIRRERTAKEEAFARGLITKDELDGGGLVNDIVIGGVHIHHQVWGLLLMLVSGMLQFAYEFSSPWLEITGAMFGVGAALVLTRLSHMIGMPRPAPNVFRATGAGGTYLLMAVMAVWGLVLGLGV